MAAPARINFKIYQGSTFGEVLRWESSDKGYVAIEAITKAAPVVVTASDHGIPVDWRIKITNVLGMTDINSDDVYHYITATDVNTITLGNLNGAGFKTYTSGGIIEYNMPIDMAGYTARMQIRARLSDETVIEELTTEDGDIVLDNTLKTITITMSAATTAAFTFNTAVYGLEMIATGGQVTPFATGTLTLVKEVTR